MSLMDRPELPEAEHAQHLSALLEGLRKGAKHVRGFTSEASLQQELYGRALSKAARSFLLSLDKANASPHLTQALRHLGCHYESVGTLYVQLSCQQTEGEDLTVLRKQLGEDLQLAIREVSGSKAALVKAKSKYERVCREFAQTQERLRTQSSVQLAKNDLRQTAETALKDCLETAQAKQNSLNISLQVCTEAVQDAERRTLETAIRQLSGFIQVNDRVVTLRAEFSEADCSEQLSAIILDLVDPGSPRTSTSQSLADRLNAKTGLAVAAVEERKGALKALKTFVGELVLAEESAGRGLGKVTSAYLLLPSCLSEKLHFKLAWDSAAKAIEVLGALHLNRCKTLSQHCLASLVTTLNSMTQLQKDAAAVSAKAVKDHLQLEDECLRAFDRLRRSADDSALQQLSQNASERMQKSAESTERQVRGLLSESTNAESRVLQGAKKVLVTLASLETESGIALIRRALGVLEAAEVWRDVETQRLPQQGQVMALDQIKTEVASKLLPTDPDDELHTPRFQDKELAKFGLPPDTQLVESFSCALVRKIALQGRLYLCTSHLCFHSYFNAVTLIGRETLFVVPLAEVLRVEKRTYAFLFDNAIAVKTKDLELLFASFLARDQALATLTCLMQLHPEAAHSPDDLPLDTPTGPRLSLTRRLRGVRVRPSREDVLRGIPPQSFYKYHILKHVEFNACMSEVFVALFESTETWGKYYASRKDTEVVMTQWAPSPPVLFGGSSDIWPVSSRRVHTFTHPVKVRAPLIPATCTCKEAYEVFFLSETQMIIEVDVKVDSVPFADHFTTRARWLLEEVDRRTYVDLHYGMHFHKDTWFQSRIEKSGVDEFTENITTHWVPQAQQIMQARQTTERLPPSTERSSQPSVVVREIRVETRLPAYLWVGVVLLCVLLLQVWRLQARVSVLEQAIESFLSTGLA